MICYGGTFDWDNAVKRLTVLNEQVADSEFWENPEQAQLLMRERNYLDSVINNCQNFMHQLQEHIEMIELGQIEQDESVVNDSEVALQELAVKANRMQVEILLSGEADQNDAFLEIHPGAGGTESQDWASMLLRMYLRWAERKGYKTELIEQTVGEEAGIKSATIKISGINAYGWVKMESGIHRLVRISPFDSQARRHTSFASVWCFPVIDDRIDIDINESDVRIDTFRASGAGGQHVNTTDSAVRITHQPTGIVVQCQNQRSQHKNKATAWDMLRARLYEKVLQERELERSENNQSKTEIGWGHQIRSYVLQPYQMVKDLRSHIETGNVQAVLDGDLDKFMESTLVQSTKETI